MHLNDDAGADYMEFRQIHAAAAIDNDVALALQQGYF